MRLLVLMLALVPVLTVAAQNPAYQGKKEPERKPDPVLARLRLKLNPELPAWSPGYVLERCAEHLATINEQDRCRIRYFDLSDVPRQQLSSMTAALFFGCNSASIAPTVSMPRPVANTDNRIFWIDLLWYRWTPEVWEKVSQEDPYFREPIIPSISTGLNYLREQTKANAVIRADWFLYYTYDTTQFLRRNATQADDAFYYQLLYGDLEEEREVKQKVKKPVTRRKQVPYQDRWGRTYYRWEDITEDTEEEIKETKKVKGFVPRTAAEFEKVWKVDLAVLKDYPIDQGAVVDENRSIVAYNNRVLWRVRTPIGVYWRTFDVGRSVGEQDFIESPFPRVFDAGEHIIQDGKGAQIYFLTDGTGKRVEFGDPRVVRDTMSGEKTIVLTAKSCIHCHDSGILPMRNEIPRLKEIGADLRAITPDRAERLRQFYLGNLQRLVKLDQDEYANFVQTCNGLTTQENAAQFSRARSWYAGAVTLTQGARELGCESKELSDALSIGTKGRLGRLILDGEPIPRLTWERGGYQEAGLLLIEYRRGARIR